MKIRDFWKKIKKPVTTALIILGLVLLFFLLAGSRRTNPENPMEEEEADASKMYVTASNLAVDESLLENIPNANITAAGITEELKEEEQKQEEIEEQIDENQEEPGEELTEETNENLEDQNSPQTSPRYDSLLQLIQKNDTVNQPSGGGGMTGGGESVPGDGDGNGSSGKNPALGGEGNTLTPEESGELFNTSIVDGEVVLDPAYFFTITLTERGKALTLVSQTVTVNGISKGFVNGDSVTLKEGANKIQVTLRFRDKAYNQVDAPTKTYTVYYFKDDHFYLSVINARTDQELENGSTSVVVDSELWLSVIAQRGTEAVNARVRLNNATVSKSSDGLYKTSLKLGNNTLKVTVGSGVNQLVFTCTINYQRDTFSVEFESIDADDNGNRIHDIITASRYGQKQAFTWASASQNFDFRISCTQATGLEKITYVGVTQSGVTTDMTHRAGADGYISMELEGFYQDSASYRGNTVYVEFLDSNGQLQNHTWIIHYERTFTPEGKEPYVIFDLVDGQKITDNPATVTISAIDWRGNDLDNWNFTVTLNGEEAPFININPKGYEYALYLDEGPNTFQVTVTDNEQYSVTRTLTLNYSVVPETIYVNLKVDAQILGLGPWIEETIPVLSNQTVAEIVEERLEAYGFTTVYSGNPSDDSYYLQRISRSGLLEGWNLSEEQIAHYGDEGYEVYEPADLNSLGERDITLGSGWMVTVDRQFIGNSMGSYKVKTGNTIYIQFTCDVGKDIDVSTY